jgi:hypothetical protein
MKRSSKTFKFRWRRFLCGVLGHRVAYWKGVGGAYHITCTRCLGTKRVAFVPNYAMGTTHMTVRYKGKIW